jgi:glycerol-3-phosphate acyltransferase PlsY
MTAILASAAGGYLLGSIPIAWLMAWFIRGVDLREVGSGNVGVTPVALHVARWAGALAFAAEFGKGVGAVLGPRACGLDEVGVYATVLAAVVGTRWPVWLSFKGGRGNSVGFGALVLISWQVVVIGLIVWTFARIVLRRSFLATRVLFISCPVIFGWITRSWAGLAFGSALAGIYLSTHNPKSDDHLLIQSRWSSLFDFLTSPPRE